MMMRKVRNVLLLLGVLLLISACSSDDEASGSSNSGGEEEMNLEMSVTTSESSTWVIAAEKLAEDIEEATDGRITIDVFSDEQLSGGDSGKAVELLSKGNIDLTVNSTIIYSALDDRFGVASATFLFDDLEDADEVFNGESGEMLEEILAEKGVKALGYGENGFRHITNSKHPIKGPEDLQGLKIRVPGI